MTKFEDLTTFEKTVFLIYANDSHRGPGMVVQNLTKGLKAIGVDVATVADPKAAAYVAGLQFCHTNLLNNRYLEKKPILMGPNLFVLPTDNPTLCQMFSHYVVPSQWVKDKYESFDLMKGKDIRIWSVGIDTEDWGVKDELKEESSQLDCFIYYKNRSEHDLAVAEAICRKYELKYKVLGYGSYQEDELRALTYSSKFAILLTGTESQGIAYMQILAANTPCYVLNNPTWRSEDGMHAFPAASVPYWDDRCGDKIDNINLKHFEEFMKKVDAGVFSPREYILKNHTLEKAAQKYYNLLRRSHGHDPVEF